MLGIRDGSDGYLKTPHKDHAAQDDGQVKVFQGSFHGTKDGVQ
jgi:hypothetical protein